MTQLSKAEKEELWCQARLENAEKLAAKAQEVSRDDPDRAAKLYGMAAQEELLAIPHLGKQPDKGPLGEAVRNTVRWYVMADMYREAERVAAEWLVKDVLPKADPSELREILKAIWRAKREELNLQTPGVDRDARRVKSTRGRANAWKTQHAIATDLVFRAKSIPEGNKEQIASAYLKAAQAEFRATMEMMKSGLTEFLGEAVINAMSWFASAQEFRNAEKAGLAYLSQNALSKKACADLRAALEIVWEGKVPEPVFVGYTRLRPKVVEEPAFGPVR